MRAQRDQQSATALGVQRARHRQSGAAAVEMALVLPLLLLIVFGIFEFAVCLYDKAVITNASREGARRGIVYGYPDRPTDGEIETAVNNYVQSHLVTFGSATDATTAIARTGTAAGDSLTVTVTYDYGFLVLPQFITTLTGAISLQGITVMRLE